MLIRPAVTALRVYWRHVCWRHEQNIWQLVGGRSPPQYRLLQFFQLTSFSADGRRDGSQQEATTAELSLQLPSALRFWRRFQFEQLSVFLHRSFTFQCFSPFYFSTAFTSWESCLETGCDLAAVKIAAFTSASNRLISPYNH